MSTSLWSLCIYHIRRIVCRHNLFLVFLNLNSDYSSNLLICSWTHLLTPFLNLDLLSSNLIILGSLFHEIAPLNANEFRNRPNWTFDTIILPLWFSFSSNFERYSGCLEILILCTVSRVWYTTICLTVSHPISSNIFSRLLLLGRFSTILTALFWSDCKLSKLYLLQPPNRGKQ